MNYIVKNAKSTLIGSSIGSVAFNLINRSHKRIIRDYIDDKPLLTQKDIISIIAGTVIPVLTPKIIRTTLFGSDVLENNSAFGCLFGAGIQGLIELILPDKASADKSGISANKKHNSEQSEDDEVMRRAIDTGFETAKKLIYSEYIYKNINDSFITFFIPHSILFFIPNENLEQCKKLEKLKTHLKSKTSKKLEELVNSDEDVERLLQEFTPFCKNIIKGLVFNVINNKEFKAVQQEFKEWSNSNTVKDILNSKDISKDNQENFLKVIFNIHDGGIEINEDDRNAILESIIKSNVDIEHLNCFISNIQQIKIPINVDEIQKQFANIPKNTEARKKAIEDICNAISDVLKDCKFDGDNTSDNNSNINLPELWNRYKIISNDLKLMQRRKVIDISMI